MFYQWPRRWLQPPELINHRYVKHAYDQTASNPSYQPTQEGYTTEECHQRNQENNVKISLRIIYDRFLMICLL